jgi:purine-binding chemotaxis protein CheW
MSVLHVLMTVAGTPYVVPAASVLHMETFTDATPIPGAVGYVIGLVQSRGRVVPVIDLRTRFGMARIEPTLDSRVVVVQLGERTVGLLVDSAREVVSIAPEDFKSPPEVVSGQGSGYVDAVAQIDKKLVLRLALASVVSDSRAAQGDSHGEQRL